ncbi:MAG TPA: zf-HC2 domain-containing protein, partial [Pyrinomonadaceae bacterium]
LPTAELLEVDDHLAACEECRQRVNVDLQPGTLLSDFHRRLLSGFRSDHLSYEQLVTIVDGELENSEHDELQAHLKACAPCTEDLNDLRALRAELNTVTAEDRERAPRRGFGEKIWAPLRSNRRSLSPAFAGALAVLLIAISIVLFFIWKAWTRSPAIEATRQVPEVLPQNISPNVGTPSPQQPPAPDGLITLNDGGSNVTVTSNGDVEGLGTLPAASVQAVKRALTTGELEVPNLSELTGVKGRLMGPNSDGSTFKLVEPVGAVTRTARPTLRWEPLTGASSYTVAILDSSYNVVTTSPSVTTTSWSPTAALDRGRIYSWQVTASKDGKQQVSPTPPEPEARFKVLDKRTADELRNIERASNSHLVRGTMYARAGLLDDAEREMRDLVAANPNSAIARQLLQRIRSNRRR